MKRVFISDCEGPISKNDNAFEITSNFVPNGSKLFTVISRYDDVLAEVLKRPNYKAGDTLKLVLPFLKAYGATDDRMRKFSAANLVLISDVKFLLRYITKIAFAFIVSTSYEHYLHALCEALEFPFANTCCTKVNIDKYGLTGKEEEKLKQISQEIAEMPILEISPEAKSLQDFSPEEQRMIKRLDEIFWNEIAKLQIGRIFSEVNPVGGVEKAEAITDIVRKSAASLANVMYVGDSITDEEAFRLVRENGGLTVAFNGNRYAVENAEVAVLSETSIVTAIIADIFIRSGKQSVLDLIKNWNRKTLENSLMNKSLINCFHERYPRELPKVKIITSENMESLARESSEFRKRIRGEAIGRLG